MRLYIIGAGAIARQHARAAAALRPALSACFVCEPRAEARGSFVAAYPHFQAHASAEAMLAPAPEPDDIVIVATPPRTHVELALQALHRGRHVLIEKPMSLEVADLARLQAAAQAAGKRFADCSNRFLGTPALTKAQALLQAGELGALQSIRWIQRNPRARPGVEYQPESPWFLDKARAGGGILLDWAPYDLHVLIELVRPRAFEVKHAWTRQFLNGREPQGAVNDVETQVGAACTLELEGGAQVELSYERASAVFGREEHLAELEGTRAAYRMDWLGWIDGGRATLSTDVAGKPHETLLELGADPLDLQFKPLHRFARFILEGQGDGDPGARSCFVQACVLALLKTAEGGGPQRVERSAWERP